MVDAWPSANVQPENRHYPEIRVTYNETGISLWVQLFYRGPQFELPLTSDEVMALVGRLGRTDELDGETMRVNGDRWPALAMECKTDAVLFVFMGEPGGVPLGIDVVGDRVRSLRESLLRAISERDRLLDDFERGQEATPEDFA
jgi:hypothetical protein